MLELLVPYLRAPEEQELGYIGLANGWQVVRNVFAFEEKMRLEEKWGLFEAWAAHDGSDEVQNQRRMVGEMLNRDKEQSWQYFLDFDYQESVVAVQHAMQGFNHESNLEQLGPFEARYYEALPKVFAEKSVDYAKAFYSSLEPIGERVEYYQEQISRLLATRGLNDVLEKKLRNSYDMNQRRLKTYKSYEM